MVVMLNNVMHNKQISFSFFMSLIIKLLVKKYSHTITALRLYVSHFITLMSNRLGSDVNGALVFQLYSTKSVQISIVGLSFLAETIDTQVLITTKNSYWIKYLFATVLISRVAPLPPPADIQTHKQ